MGHELFLFDANAIIEAVRTNVWNALTGGLRVETVEEVRRECLSGIQLSSGYIQVDSDDLERMSAIHPVSQTMRATVSLLESASALDAGERDLFAYIACGELAGAWWVCSPDKASIRFAAANEMLDRLISLEEVAVRVGARADSGFRSQFTGAWLSQERTKVLLDDL